MMRPNSSYLAVQLALCWVHEGRHYKKLTPATAFNQLLLEHFLDCYWDYYDQLLQYREQPSVEAAELLRQQFQELFATTTGYWEKDIAN